MIPGLGRSLGEGNGNPFQYSCLGNPMDRGAWRATVHGDTKESDTIVTKLQQRYIKPYVSNNKDILNLRFPKTHPHDTICINFFKKSIMRNLP